MVWSAVHTLAAAIMQFYCVAGTTFGKLTPRRDADPCNTAPFRHFMAITALVTAAGSCGT